MKLFLVLSLVLALASQSCKPESEAVSENEAHVTEGYFTGAGGVQLFYRALGSVPDTVVVLHGGPGCDMEYLIPDLEPLTRHHTVIYYDQLGAGRSELPDTTQLTIEQYVEDLEILRKFFRLRQITLIGHSFGSLLANFYMRDYPQLVERVILIGGLPPEQRDFNRRYAENLNGNLSPEERTQMQDLGRQMLSGPDTQAACSKFWELALRPRFADPAKIADMRGDLCAASAETIVYAYSKTGSAIWSSIGAWDFRDALAKCAVPTLLIHGEEEAIPIDMVEEWTQVLPNARLLRVADAAHFPYVEQPEIVWPAIEVFLRGEWPSGLETSMK